MSWVKPCECASEVMVRRPGLIFSYQITSGLHAGLSAVRSDFHSTIWWAKAHLWTARSEDDMKVSVRRLCMQEPQMFIKCQKSRSKKCLKEELFPLEIYWCIYKMWNFKEVVGVMISAAGDCKCEFMLCIYRNRKYTKYINRKWNKREEVGSLRLTG